MLLILFLPYLNIQYLYSLKICGKYCFFNVRWKFFVIRWKFNDDFVTIPGSVQTNPVADFSETQCDAQMDNAGLMPNCDAANDPVPGVERRTSR